jgi:F-type H+-transporting ATPase subunit a
VVRRGGSGSFLAADPCAPHDPGYCAPTVKHSFFFDPIATFKIGGVEFRIDKVSVLLFLGVALIVAFFLLAARKRQLVPGKLQFAGEEAYGFIRNSIAREVIGSQDGMKYATFLASLFFFIIVMNIWEIIPGAQMPVNAHFTYPVFLAAISYVLFNYAGIRQHGLVGYLRTVLFPPGVPLPLYILITPIEIASTLIFRPFTLAVRLFANMFAGHLLLTIFFSGTIFLLNVDNFSKVFVPAPFLMSVIMTFFELLVATLQAYVFTVLTAVYVSGALAEEH